MNFFIPLTPEPQRRGKIVKWGKVWGLARNKKQELSEALLIPALKKFRPNSPITGPVILDVLMLLPHAKSHSKKLRESRPMHTIKPDRSNMLKHVEDCMQKSGFFADDCQIVGGLTVKAYAPVSGWLITVREATEVDQNTIRSIVDDAMDFYRKDSQCQILTK